ncbi:hypothetical protein ElyMa_006638700 [Elysia marginata]|uniref:Uncharacterized protein n=1 Tax=Elysia marginata TaxID=1093978 RepID=A0AAV4INK5_9GAST|nr:hypothetical protein ElyMa_006638700 [Elysia marginata]
MYLAQALDRLRIHSLSNKSSSYRLRMNGDDISKTTSPSGHAQTPRANMVTTVEKFRQMRPKRQPPVIFPLQGRQLLESQSLKEKDNSLPNEVTQRAGNSTSRSVKEADMTARSLPSKVDETVQANLQRLLQPTSSIPNIGRKALKKQQSFEPKTRALLNGRDSNNSNTTGNRFITRPRVIVPKRSPTLASPDTIIEAVTNSNLIYSMNQYHNDGNSSTHSASNSNNNINNNNNNYQYNARNGVIYDETICSESDSVKSDGGGYGALRNASNNNRDAHYYNKNVRKTDPRDLEYRDPHDRETFPALNARDSDSHSLHKTNHNIICIPGCEESSERQCEMEADLELEVKDTLQWKENQRDHPNQHSNSLSMGRKLYRSGVGPVENNKPGYSKLPPWQSRNHHIGDTKTRTHPRNDNSMGASRTNSQTGYNTVTSHKEGRNSIDIYLPSSHPFGTPFVRSESNLSRENTTGSENGWFRMTPYNPSAESIQPGTRFPTINVSNVPQEQLHQRVTTTTSEGRRSRSSSQGDVSLPARHHKMSSLPNVRSRYMTQRRRSNSSGEGFSEESGSCRRDAKKPWARISNSQDGRRRAVGAAEDTEEEEGTEDTQSSLNKRHIVIDMPSIIFNAASPDVTVEHSTLTSTVREVNQVQGHGSTPQSRTGGQSSSSTVATPTGWSPASGTPTVPNLSKAVKQQEIRKRELQNLLEDVRELNIRTEVLSSQSEGGGKEDRQ